MNKLINRVETRRYGAHVTSFNDMQQQLNVDTNRRNQHNINDTMTTKSGTESHARAYLALPILLYLHFEDFPCIFYNSADFSVYVEITTLCPGPRLDIRTFSSCIGVLATSFIFFIIGILILVRRYLCETAPEYSEPSCVMLLLLVNGVSQSPSSWHVSCAVLPYGSCDLYTTFFEFYPK